ncbi:hypothetical protein P3T23_008403 [Paraburkholderia sp. GAS448]|jgi:hypothetical protein|uniref:hypothetical protein n=1 Tax=Paraburkholderia sp. GAS448 TaxID=3035136 RepID=UPI003D1C0E00
MDQKTREAIFKMKDRGMRLRAQVDEDASHFVTVERAELRGLLIDHAFVCGFALGMPPIAEEPREQA